ncbi:DUF1433 domain-containing protein [Anaerobacillus sp. 1_MG-2023]|uniref:DUF1433 domain-containing protein n=1 Tax=Anaerobacillus sp. 1_MG-2023 TaxID=3062655 RepID=UPI0026E24962|nr:DUF1433 domain-containing protein [Anaerobacillus sp. 1_MG-2023]MDO6654537.1 DUF1433 domain-containing protein [Anaerobacillus sp. 1_MG-2023]
MKSVYICLISLLVLLSGCSVNSTDDEILEKAKEKAESYLKNNYQNVSEVTFVDDPNNPMDGITVEGTVNGEAEFTIAMDERFEIAGVSRGKNFPEKKDACKEQICAY